jgi:hypothetical protein
LDKNKIAQMVAEELAAQMPAISSLENLADDTQQGDR